MSVRSGDTLTQQQKDILMQMEYRRRGQPMPGSIAEQAGNIVKQARSSVDTTLGDIETQARSNIMNVSKVAAETVENVFSTQKRLEEEAGWAESRSVDTQTQMEARRTGKTLTTPAQQIARAQHLALSAGIGAAQALPFAIAAVVGGPIVGGLIAAASISAAIINRDAIGKYINEHPEEFAASLVGALVAGAGVNKVKSIYSKYKSNLKVADAKKIQAKLDKEINDTAYAGQAKGDIFPTERKGTALTPQENEFLDTIKDPWERYVSEKLVRSNPELKSQLAKYDEPRFAIFTEPGAKVPQILDVGELVTKYPKLKQPWINPAQETIDFVTRGGVARIPVDKLSTGPLLVAALAIISQQGYITDSQLKDLTVQNEKAAQEYGQASTQVAAQQTEQLMKSTVKEVTETTSKTIEKTDDKTRDQFGLRLPKFPRKQAVKSKFVFDKEQKFIVKFEYGKGAETKIVKSNSFPGALATALSTSRKEPAIRTEIRRAS